MSRFLVSFIANTVAWFAFFDWSRLQAEGQIDQMQKAAFDTPGAEAPIPPSVVAAGAGVLLGQLLLTRLLGLGAWGRWLSLLLGSAAGAAILAAKFRRPQNSP